MNTIQLPSFSIMLETENLINADMEGLSHALTSLLNQDIPLTQAKEVWLIESGDIPANLLQQLRDRYPWITVHPAPVDTGYYKAKMLGAQLATGEVIVYCDSDCIYEPHWLRTLLTPFAQRSDIQVVAGETTTRGVGPYGTAMALTYIFPQYSGETDLAPTPQYYLNNVAFRREFLLQHPIPPELPLYRGNCVVHAAELARAGYTIWRQPQARATHAPPNGLSHFFWRFLLIGHDLHWQQELMQEKAESTPRSLTMSGFQFQIQAFSQRMGRLFQNDPRHLLFFLLALPTATVAVVLIAIGYWITRLSSPHGLVTTYDRILSDA